MIKSYIKFINLKKILENNLILICYDFFKINSCILNILKKNFLIKIIFINKKILNFFNLYYNKSLYLLIIDNNIEFLKKIMIFIFNLTSIKPFFISDKNTIIKEIPLKEISKLSKENLIIKLLNFLKNKILNLKNILKLYAKSINK